MSIFSNLQRDVFQGGSGISGDQKSTLYDYLKDLAAQSARLDKPAADATAATVTAERAFYVAGGAEGRRLKSVKFMPGAALTASNTDYATLRIRRRSAVGADLGVVAQVTTQITGSGNWVANTPVSIPITTGALTTLFDLKAGEFLTFEILKAGSGVAVPAGMLYADVE